MLKSHTALIASLLFISAAARAEIQTREITYEHEGSELTGYLAWDDAAAGKRPGVLVVHEWWGLTDYIKGRARDIAKLGYVAFAPDMYGRAKVTRHGREAKAWMEQITANTRRWQARALRGLQILQEQDEVDPGKVAAIGYCFGGATVMQMAYSGADLAAVVSFHGSLPVPTEKQAKAIRAPVLAAHGDADKFVPPERVQQFQQALEKAGADWLMVIYGGARHGFTNPNAAQYGIENIQYAPQAARRSWEHMKIFLADAFK
jgi:dienelactone hydrolase